MTMMLLWLHTFVAGGTPSPPPPEGEGYRWSWMQSQSSLTFVGAMMMTLLCLHTFVAHRLGEGVTGGRQCDIRATSLVEEY